MDDINQLNWKKIGIIWIHLVKARNNYCLFNFLIMDFFLNNDRREKTVR